MSLQVDIAFPIVTPDLWFDTTRTTKTTDISTHDIKRDSNSHFRLRVSAAEPDSLPFG